MARQPPPPPPPTAPGSLLEALVQPALAAAVREVAELRPAEPLIFLADRLLSAAASPASAPPAGKHAQTVAAYLSESVLPAVQDALSVLLRHQPPVEDAQRAVEIVAQCLLQEVGADA